MYLEFLHTAEQKQPKARYCKPESLKELERIHFERKKVLHPNVPYLVKTLFRDDTANELTKCIVSWLQLNGHFGGRVNTTGIYSIKQGKYIHSGSRKGMADITAVIDGKHVSIEVKTGRDRMRPEQLKVKREIEQAGGTYIVVTSFDNFLEQLRSFSKSTGFY